MSEAFVTEVPLVEAAVGEQALLASCNITVLRLKWCFWGDSVVGVPVGSVAGVSVSVTGSKHLDPAPRSPRF